MAVRRTKRTDGRYTVTIRHEGRRHFFDGKTQAEAKSKAQAALKRLEAGAPVRDATRTLSDWLAEWQETFLKASDRAASTKAMYGGLCRVWIEPTIGHVRLDRLVPADVTRLMLVMEAEGRAPSTRRSTYAALRGALDDAVRNGLLAMNPVEKVKRPRLPHRESRSLAPDEVASFLKGTADLRYAAVLRLILGTGLRRGEALALRWSDIDLERREASVTGSLVRVDGVLTISDTKSMPSRRTISLSPSMAALLKTLPLALSRAT